MSDFLLNLTPNPFPTSEREQKSKPLVHCERGMEVGFQEEVAHRVKPDSRSGLGIE